MFAPILESGSKDDSNVRFSSLPSTTDSLSSYFGDSSGKRLKRFRSQYRYNKTPSNSSKSSLSLPRSTSKSSNVGKGYSEMKVNLLSISRFRINLLLRQWGISKKCRTYLLSNI